MQVLVNVVVALGCATFLTHLLLTSYRIIASRETVGSTPAILVCFGLFALWFPLRLYSEWYLSFYTLRSFRDYYAFWFLLAIATLALFLTVIILKPESIWAAHAVTL